MSPMSPMTPEIRILSALVAALALGSLARLLVLGARSDEEARARRASLRSWWILTVFFVAAVLTGPLGVCVLLGAASWLAFDELSRLVAQRGANRLTKGLVFASIPFVQVLLLLGGGERILLAFPLVVLPFVIAAQLLDGAPAGWVRSTGGLFLGALLAVGGLAHASLLYLEPPATNPLAGRAGWFVYLVVLTELNDIAQAVVGRRFGARGLIPRISPHKTLEGLLGGAAITLAAGLALAPLLTTLDERAPPAGLALPPALSALFWPTLAGAVVVAGGLLGDLCMSAVKRDAGVEDSSGRLPGMGGVLDRVDSLTLTAPCLYWLITRAGG